jgi:hypothetical protein
MAKRMVGQLPNHNTEPSVLPALSLSMRGGWGMREQMLSCRELRDSKVHSGLWGRRHRVPSV